MSESITQSALDALEKEYRHFIDAPTAFFESWKHGVHLAGPQWFGDKTPAGVIGAKSKWDLCPDVDTISMLLGTKTAPVPQPNRDKPESEYRHLFRGPAAYFETWKRGIQIAGPHWFGDGTPAGMTNATRMRDLRPQVRAISRSFGVLSSGERLFLAAMVSFFEAHDGYSLLRRCRFEGLADLSGLDLQRRQVIANLIVHATPMFGSGDQMFLAALVSFYNAHDGGMLLGQCGFKGLSDLKSLDLQRRRVIADLILNYSGW